MGFNSGFKGLTMGSKEVNEFFLDRSVKLLTIKGTRSKIAQTEEKSTKLEEICGFQVEKVFRHPSLCHVFL